MSTHPILGQETVVQISRVAKLSLNKPYVQTMTVREALAGKWFDTSHGTMSVHAVVVEGEHKGALVYSDKHGVARARYNPKEQVQDGRYFWELDEL